MAAAVTKINVLPLFSRAEQRPFKIPVHVPAKLTCHLHCVIAPNMDLATQKWNFIVFFRNTFKRQNVSASQKNFDISSFCALSKHNYINIIYISITN